MPYILELSGVVSYEDGEQKSFLAQDDIQDDIILQDEQGFNDVDQRFKQLIIGAGGNLALPRTTVKSGRVIATSHTKLSCWYTIDQESYEYSVVNSDTTGLLGAGDGSLAHFMNAYGANAQNFINTIFNGATLYAPGFAQTILLYLKSIAGPQPIIVGLYSQVAPTPILIVEKQIDPNNEAAVYFNKNGFITPWVHVRPAGTPRPEGSTINAQLSLLGVTQVDAIVGPGPSYNIGLTNPIFS